MLHPKKYCLLLLSLFFLQRAFAQTGTIKGNVFDNVSKDPLAGAYFSVDNTGFHVVADDKGNFQFQHLPAADYGITITNVGYLTSHRRLSVQAGATARLFAGLGVEGRSMEEVTVFGRADREKETGSRDRERNAANMINVISSQAMVRSPDISAANVLQRMSAVTIQRSSGGDEAYAIIRGMEPRYNNTLLNGIKIASPDNKNRYVQLGIIPSDILSSIEVSKTLTADMEGDATGGTVNMVVKDALDKSSFKATASVGYSQLYFDEKYLTFYKGDIQSQSPYQRNPPGHTVQPGDFSRSNLDFHSVQAPPTGQLGFSFTHRYLHDKLGFVLADNVQNQYYGNTSFQATVTPGADTTGKLYPSDANNFKEYTQQLNNGLVTHLDYVINQKNKINVDNFYLYSYLAQSRIDVDHVLIGTGAVSYSPTTGQYFTAMRSQTQSVYVENLKLPVSMSFLPASSWTGQASIPPPAAGPRTSPPSTRFTSSPWTRTTIYTRRVLYSKAWIASGKTTTTKNIPASSTSTITNNGRIQTWRSRPAVCTATPPGTIPRTIIRFHLPLPMPPAGTPPSPSGPIFMLCSGTSFIPPMRPITPTITRPPRPFMTAMPCSGSNRPSGRPVAVCGVNIRMINGM